MSPQKTPLYKKNKMSNKNDIVEDEDVTYIKNPITQRDIKENGPTHKHLIKVGIISEDGTINESLLHNFTANKKTVTSLRPFALNDGYHKKLMDKGVLDSKGFATKLASDESFNKNFREQQKCVRVLNKHVLNTVDIKCINYIVEKQYSKLAYEVIKAMPEEQAQELRKFMVNEDFYSLLQKLTITPN